MQGATPLCPPEARLVERFLKECVSSRGQRVGCPLTNTRGLQSGAVSPQRRSHKGDVRCVPRFLMEAPPAARGRPLDPGCRRTLGLSYHVVPARTVFEPAYLISTTIAVALSRPDSATASRTILFADGTPASSRTGRQQIFQSMVPQAVGHAIGAQQQPVPRSQRISPICGFTNWFPEPSDCDRTFFRGWFRASRSLIWPDRRSQPTWVWSSGSCCNFPCGRK